MVNILRKVANLYEPIARIKKIMHLIEQEEIQTIKIPLKPEAKRLSWLLSQIEHKNKIAQRQNGLQQKHHINSVHHRQRFLAYVTH